MMQTNDDPREGAETLDNGKLTPAEAAQMGLIGPDNPDEDDHQSKLDALDTSIEEAQREEARRETDMKADDLIEGSIHTEAISSTPEANPFPMAEAAKFLFGGEDVELVGEQTPTEDVDEVDLAAVNRRTRTNTKLRELGQAALDRLWDEHLFNNDPRFKEANELLMADGEAPTIEQSTRIFESLREHGRETFIEFITKSMKLPTERQMAAAKYLEYRSMVEDFS